MTTENTILENIILKKVIKRSIIDEKKRKQKLDDEKKQILNDKKLAIEIDQSLNNYPTYLNLTMKDFEIRNQINILASIHEKIFFDQKKLNQNIIEFENKFKDIKLNQELSIKIKINTNNINILKSNGDGSCLLHSINYLLFINNYCIFLEPQIWRNNISKFIDNYILSNLSKYKLTTNEEILLNSLIEEKNDLEKSLGWLSETTISIICTIFEFNIKIINFTTNDHFIIKGLLNNNFTNLKGGLAFNGNHWDCFVD